MQCDFTPVKKTLTASAILIIPRMLYRGVVLYFCWIWFMMPFGLPPLDFWTASVMGGVISVLTFEHIGEGKSRAEAFKKLIEWLIGISVFFLAAFLIHIWIQEWANSIIYSL